MEAAIGSAEIVRALEGELLRHVAAQPADGDLRCFRLACTAFCAHSAPPSKRSRSAFTRSVPLARFAWEELIGFRAVEAGHLVALAAGVGSVDAIAWLRGASSPMPQ